MPRTEPVERICYACGVTHMAPPRATRCQTCKEAGRKVPPEIQKALSKTANVSDIRPEVTALVAGDLSATEAKRVVLDAVSRRDAAAAAREAAFEANAPKREAKAKREAELRELLQERLASSSEFNATDMPPSSVADILKAMAEADREERKLRHKIRLLEEVQRQDRGLRNHEQRERRAALKAGVEYRHHFEDYHETVDARSLGLEVATPQ